MEYARVMNAPRIRHFPWLGWTVVCVPLDVFEYAGVARMWFGTWMGFEPEDIHVLRARRLGIDDEPDRTWWVLGIPYDRWTAKVGLKATVE
jgi:hypothetical protein